MKRKRRDVDEDLSDGESAKDGDNLVPFKRSKMLLGVIRKTVVDSISSVFSSSSDDNSTGMKPARETSTKDSCSCDSGGSEPLFRAAKNGDNARIRQWIQNGHSINAKDDHGKTALDYASENGHLNAIRSQVEHGADNEVEGGDGGSAIVDDRQSLSSNNEKRRKRDDAVANTSGDNDGNVLLFEAAKKGDVALATVLFETGHNDVNATDACGWTALEYACKCYEDGAEEVALLLIQHGANVNVRGSSPLIIRACDRDNTNFAKLILENGADVNTQDHNGDTALHWTSTNGQLDYMKLLLEHGADLHVRNGDENTPIHVAMADGSDKHRNQFDVVKLLIESGADIHLRGDPYYGWTALHAACRYVRQLEVVQLLLEKGADIRAKDNLGETPLHVACKYRRHSEILLQFLLNCGADLNAKADDGSTPLHLACGYCSTNDIKFLLKNGADPNAKDKNGLTPLHKELLDEWCTEVVVSLLENGADVNAKDNNGVTPFHVACENSQGQLDVVEPLLSHGANVNTKTLQGRTPLHLASEADDPEIVWFLVRNYPWLVLDPL